MNRNRYLSFLSDQLEEKDNRENLWTVTYPVECNNVWSFEQDDETCSIFISIPGYKKDELEILIRAPKFQIVGTKKNKFAHIPNSMYHEFTIDDKYDLKSCEASLENGVLTLKFVAVNKTSENGVCRVEIK